MKPQSSVVAVEVVLVEALGVFGCVGVYDGCDVVIGGCGGGGGGAGGGGSVVVVVVNVAFVALVVCGRR